MLYPETIKVQAAMRSKQLVEEVMAIINSNPEEGIQLYLEGSSAEEQEEIITAALDAIKALCRKNGRVAVTEFHRNFWNGHRAEIYVTPAQSRQDGWLLLDQGAWGETVLYAGSVKVPRTVLPYGIILHMEETDDGQRNCASVTVQAAAYGDFTTLVSRWANLEDYACDDAETPIYGQDVARWAISDYVLHLEESNLYDMIALIEGAVDKTETYQHGSLDFREAAEAEKAFCDLVEWVAAGRTPLWAQWKEGRPSYVWYVEGRRRNRR